MGKSNNTKRVLVAEDELMIATLWKIALVDHDWEVVVARNGARAIDKLKEETFNLVITDLKMPEKDGLEVITYIQEQKLDLPVIVCSGYIEDESKLMAHSCVFKVLKKPIDIAKAVDTIQTEINSL